MGRNPEESMSRFLVSREFYIPAGAVKVADKKSDAVAYLYRSGNRPAAVVFFGAQAKPIARVAFQSEFKRERYIAHWFEARQGQLARKAAAQAERKAFRHSYKVGDLFRSSWGYEQTNVDYYEVVEVRGANLVVRKIAQEASHDSSMSGKCVPLPGEFVGEPMVKRAQDGYFRVASYANAYYVKPQIVAGVPVYGSSYWSSYH
jgi:hypothetical protein